MSSAGPNATAAASASAPTWANTSGPSRPAVEDHRGTAGGGLDELLAPVSTLDEPVKETIMRDVRAVGAKLRAVLIPLDRNEENVDASEGQRNVLNQLRDWDLWGPLFICLSLAIILSLRAPTKQTSHVFTTVFVVMWIGSLVVTINAQLLGANMSIFQSLCVLGYCVFPLTVSALTIALLRVTWLGQFVKKERRLLALYPVFFFYLILGWLILLF
eukprot:scaffold6333_cov105-Skeletonema_dohrnii-CCMP3373.AAC.2